MKTYPIVPSIPLAVSAAIASAILFAGCASKQPSTVPAHPSTTGTTSLIAKVSADVVSSGALNILAQIGTTAALASSHNVRDEGAALWLWSSTISKFLAVNGTAPTSDQLQAMASSVGVKVNLQSSADVVNLVMGQLQIVVSKLGGDPALVVQAISQMASGVAAATQSYAPEV